MSKRKAVNINGGGVDNVYVCKRIDCRYHARPESTAGSCDYRTIVGHGRGCPIDDCTLYAPGERENHKSTKGAIRECRDNIGTPKSIAHAAQNVPWTKLNETTERKEPRPMVTLENTDTKATQESQAPAKRGRNSEQTAIITSALIEGMTVNKICDTYGFKKQAVYDIQSKLRKNGTLQPKARKRAESKSTEKQGSIPETQPEPIQSVATADNEPETTTALVNLPSVNSVHVDEALVRAANILTSIPSTDSTKLKAAALLMVREIIDQAYDRLEGGA